MKEIILNTVYSKRKDYKKHKAIVDDKDYDSLMKYKWYIANRNPCIYAQTSIDGHHIYMHKFLTGYKQTDHIDGNGLNNQRNNLREVTHSQNHWNRKKYPGTSQYKGVYWNKDRNLWSAQIKLKNKTYNLGGYRTEQEAAQAYNNKAIEFFGEYARLNNVPLTELKRVA